MSKKQSSETHQTNGDPVAGGAGSCPVGSIGTTGGAAVGAALGAPFGPIGMIVGGAIGAVAGGVAGHALGERVDSVCETEYWKYAHTSRPYYDKTHGWADYEPAYRYGWESRTHHGARDWNEELELELERGWSRAQGKSTLAWNDAKDAVRDAWDRTDRMFDTYRSTDEKWRGRFSNADYYTKTADYDRDYAPAYRYGTFSRHRYSDRFWDDSLERDLERDWDRVKGTSRLPWHVAREAVKDAWHGAGYPLKNADPVADILTRIRNGIQRGVSTIEVPASRMEIEVAEILKADGFISGYRCENDRNTPVLVIELGVSEMGLPGGRARQTERGQRRRVEFSGPFATKEDVHRIIAEEESLLADAPPLKVDLYEALVETVNRSLGHSGQ